MLKEHPKGTPMKPYNKGVPMKPHNKGSMTSFTRTTPTPYQDHPNTTPGPGPPQHHTRTRTTLIPYQDHPNTTPGPGPP